MTLTKLAVFPLLDPEEPHIPAHAAELLQRCLPFGQEAPGRQEDEWGRGEPENPTAPQWRQAPDHATAFLTRPLSIEWIAIPAGEFMMGSDKDQDPLASANEMPQHALYLEQFAISRYPITNSQYRAFVLATGCRPPQHWHGGEFPHSLERHPVVFVSWHDANAYCAWASAVAGRMIRLPSEAEWEKAARSDEGRVWPWGNRPPDGEHCNADYRVGTTTAVNAYPPGASPYGVMDMAGNVCEWTRTLHEEGWLHLKFRYPYDPDDGREDMDAPDWVPRILRGGAFLSDNHYTRCAARYQLPADASGKFVGFRVALAPKH
jgi:formylglycine-generating enzyme required for sulfatase activity